MGKPTAIPTKKTVHLGFQHHRYLAQVSDRQLFNVPVVKSEYQIGLSEFGIPVATLPRGLESFPRLSAEIPRENQE